LARRFRIAKPLGTHELGAGKAKRPAAHLTFPGRATGFAEKLKSGKQQ